MRTLQWLILGFGLAAGAVWVTMPPRPSHSQVRMQARGTVPAMPATLPPSAAAPDDRDRYDADDFDAF
ncbi:hypothetical protein [Methylobacterium oxalidis]|uniref:Uncharacterized protein n=1 Tax=Methylobacterium oxalidis TaxID=944322 RepID=A0A512J438_9HYPH|nr:hypothetical protein [Methylobacterium oxalidis]GEP04777.1 hypothetical protein MOX02_28150 [Methylobacterium oxalidis]GJE30476.1 hypothetical protein LDDCCGHA_0644 [Methylobacterium oxalidis]GLS63603.1 hypothetical protein GCM10007888_19840 [Methylobacterium oxalidis]